MIRHHLEADGKAAIIIWKSLEQRYKSDPLWQVKETAPILMHKKHDVKPKK